MRPKHFENTSCPPPHSPGLSHPVCGGVVGGESLNQRRHTIFAKQLSLTIMCTECSKISMVKFGTHDCNCIVSEHIIATWQLGSLSNQLVLLLLPLATQCSHVAAAWVIGVAANG